MIVCLGTTPALARTMEFERLAVDGVNRAVRVYEYTAGKAVNAARAAATLHEQVECLSPIGGTTGDRFISLTRGFTSAFVETQAEMRLCVTVVDRYVGTSTELIEESPRLELREVEQLLKMLRRRAEEGRSKVFIFSGSLARGVPAAFYAECLAIVHASGGRAILDASGEALQYAIDARPDVVKVNSGELATSGGGSETITAAKALAARTGGAVIVTRGSESTIAVAPDGRAFDVSVPAVKVVSAIGSGDSFAGGFAVGLVREMTFESSLALATACASANAMTADAAHFTVDDVERLRGQVVITAM